MSLPLTQNLMDATQIKEFQEIKAKLGAQLCNEEWAYFQEYSRNFKSNPADTRYGILIMGSAAKEENMIYAKDPAELRLKHLKALTQWGTGSPGHQQRKFLNWLETMEGRV